MKPQRPSLPGFHTTGREPKRAHSRVVFKNTTEIPRKDPQRSEEMKIVAGERTKSAKFWAVRRREVRRRGSWGGERKKFEKHQIPTVQTNHPFVQRERENQTLFGLDGRKEQSAITTQCFVTRHNQQSPPSPPRPSLEFNSIQHSPCGDQGSHKRGCKKLPTSGPTPPLNNTSTPTP